jgi:hypothetical protein
VWHPVVDIFHVLYVLLQFWSLVPVDHILARLEIDTPVIAKRLVDLLFNSYFPETKPLDVQLSRAVQLIRTNAGAARRFYLYAFSYISTLSSGEYFRSVSVILRDFAYDITFCDKACLLCECSLNMTLAFLHKSITYAISISKAVCYIARIDFGCN